MDLILAHGHCPDGFVAAMIAKRRYPEAEVIFLDHGASHAAILEKCIKRDVLMLDFSLRTREENDALAASTRSFHILDHHKTAQAVLEDAPYAIFDMKRSGAGLTWDYLFGYEDFRFGVENPLLHSQPRPRPWFVDYIEDRDLWNWKLPNSRTICAYLGTLPLEFPAWQHLYTKSVDDVITLGWGALAHIEHYVREAVKQAQTGVFEGYKTAVLNIPYLNCSEVGNELAKTHDISLTYFERANQTYQFSLRSIGDKDVSEIAKKHGGGGHKNAAGFQLPVLDGRGLVDEILDRNVYHISGSASGPRHG